MSHALQQVEVGNETTLLPLIDLIYQAVEDVSLWPKILDRLAAMVEGENVVLFANYADSTAEDIKAFACGDAAIWTPYAEHYASVNVWTERCDRIFPTGDVRYSHIAVSDHELEKTEFYADWLEPNGFAYGFGVEIALGDQTPALLSGIRSRRSGPFEEQDGHVLKMLLPHLQRALRLHLQFSQLRSNAQGMEAALDAFDHAVFGLNRDGQVVSLNAAARKVAQVRDGIGLVRDRIKAMDSRTDAELQFLIAGITAGKFSLSTGGALQAPRRCGEPLSITLIPFAPVVASCCGQLAALVFVSDPNMKARSRAAILQSLYRLSPSEARLATLLSQESDIRRAAERMRITYNSARSLLKLVFQKTGVSSQSALMRLVLSLPGDI